MALSYAMRFSLFAVKDGYVLTFISQLSDTVVYSTINGLTLCTDNVVAVDLFELPPE
jgi:hypothetical protein